MLQSNRGCSFDDNLANFGRNIGILIDSFSVLKSPLAYLTDPSCNIFYTSHTTETEISSDEISKLKTGKAAGPFNFKPSKF